MKLLTVSRELAPDFREISPEKSVVLPKTAYVIPILFWTTLFGILLGALVVGQLGKMKVSEATKKEQIIKKLESESRGIDNEIEEVRLRVVKATNLYDWVTQVPMVQPFIVSYFESFNDKDRVSRIRLNYSEDFPGQFSFETVYQGDAPTITSLFQRNTVSVAKAGWTMAQTERKIQGNTVVIKSLVRVDKEAPWALYGHSEQSFNQAVSTNQ